jgi:phosphoglycolate phosphatase-like HAD superfamily hydrolase
VTSEDVLAVWHLGPTAVVLAHLLGRPATAADLRRFRRCLSAAVTAVEAFAGVPQLLGDLDDAGYELGVVTAATRWAAELMLTNAGLIDSFTCIVGGDEVSRPKPAPDGIESACRCLDVAPPAAAYVGDAPVDVEAAQRAGCLPILATWGGTSLARGHVAVAHEPSDVLALVRSHHR